MNILITGSCGFIGFNLSIFLLKKKFKVIGIDNLNNYYDVKFKKKRLQLLKKYKNFKFYEFDLADQKKVDFFFKKNKINSVIHLAAQAGVRYSIDHPKKYVHSNIVGFHNILENCRLKSIKNIILASSSSVYGDKNNFPLKETESINPKNFYGLTKKNNEEMSEIYSKLYNMNICALRFFTVYGEWGRPDMFMLKYLMSYKKFDLYNNGLHFRDFTYIQDVNEIIFRLIKKRNIGFSVFNICSNKPFKITRVIQMIDNLFYRPKLKINKVGLQKADVIKTHGSNKKIINYTKFNKFTSLETGISNLVSWYKKNQ
ncbi:GDP-mannose 4,6-dehydratase [Pelagibacterales bacterium SAG-MED39]|nr:GDP-mannose 4,6-dehydratase [Pelagibacterales bacterium SAG-MED39]